MGAIHFSLDPQVVRFLCQHLALETFVETGSYEGDTLSSVAYLFNDIWTVESSQALFERLSGKYAGRKNFHLSWGDSPEFLASKRSLFKGHVLFWLDAHWCVADNVKSERSQCPLLRELEAISSLTEESVILIDDARLFLAPPPRPHNAYQWPSFQQILERLQALSPNHSLMVLNDVIFFAPKKIEQQLHAFAVEHGVDWLHFCHQHRERQQTAYEIDRLKSRIEELELGRVPGHTCPPVPLMRKFSMFMVNRLYYVFKETVGQKVGIFAMHDPDNVCEESFPVATMKELPGICVVTPTRNQAGFIEKTICSVLDQNYPDLDYRVQDGASTDATISILRKYEGRLKWFSQRDKGQAHAINLGFGGTDASIMAYLNSDDLLMPGVLHFVADYFARHPEVDVLYGDRLVIDQEGRQIGEWIMPPHDRHELRYADYVPQETLFWRRAIWEKAGGEMDESFQFALDWDLLLRFQRAGAKIRHVPFFLGCFTLHEAQKTNALMAKAGEPEMAKLRARECDGPVELSKIQFFSHKLKLRAMIYATFVRPLMRSLAHVRARRRESALTMQ